MLLTLTTTHQPATDLGFLLHKHPEKHQAFSLPFGTAHVFYPVADENRCTAALVLDVDPVALVRGRQGARSGGLLDQYVNDRPYAASSGDSTFLHDQKGRIVYFCDAHDLKAYINPNGRNSLDGFRFEAERITMPDRDPDLRMRSDQIISGLLFVDEAVVGLLPSHGKQMDHEVAFQNDRYLRRQENLLKKAQAELNRVGPQLRRYVLAAEHEGSDDLIEKAIRLIQEKAPMLIALLRSELDTTPKRLNAVVGNSNLALWDALDWSDFGAADVGGEQPSDARPSVMEVGVLLGRLGEFAYRHNSADSNWADASALLHLSRLDKAVRARTGERTRVCLVSRAWTLLQAAIEIAEERREPLLVRHPRLLALRSSSADQLDTAGALTLDTALNIYRGQLRQIDHAREMGPTEREEAAKEAAKAFLEGSWGEFEKNRLTFEAKSQFDGELSKAAENPVDGNRAMLVRLLEIFKSGHQPGIVLNRIFLKSFVEFGETAARFLLNDQELRQPARVDMLRTGRIRVTPLTTCSVGPLELAAWNGMPQDGQRATLDELARAVENRSHAERFLVWATALASASRWKQAGFFAQAARQVAELEQSLADKDPDGARNAKEIQHEAALLRIEIRRLGARALSDADDDLSNPTERFEASIAIVDSLKEWNKSRVDREDAAQVVEAFLLGAEIPDLGARVRRLVDALNAHIDYRERTEHSKARLISLLLLMYLTSERKPEFWPDRSDADRKIAEDRHRQLGELFSRLRDEGSADALPYRGRALALVSYRLFAGAGLSGESSWRKINPVPETVFNELAPVQHALQNSSDAIAGLLREEVDALAAVLRKLYSPSLTLAPVRPSRFEANWGNLGDDIAAKVRTVYGEVQPIIDEYRMTGLEGRHVELLQRSVAKFKQFLDDEAGTIQDEKLLFHLRSEQLLLTLLAATVRPEHERADALIAVDAEYQRLISDYPSASLPYVRRYHIAYARNPDEAIGLLNTARKLVDNDPFLDRAEGGTFHWLQSFVRRRLCFDTLSAEGTERFDGAGDVMLQLGELKAAVAELIELERLDRAPAADDDHREEAKRRANNIIYYVSRILERGSNEDVAELVTTEELEILHNRLIPTGLNDVDDTGLLHTLGCYFAAKGWPARAAEAGSKIVAVIQGRVVDQLISEIDYKILGEAASWASAKDLAADDMLELAGQSLSSLS